MPAIILGGIYGGVFTATEAAAVSVVYAAFVCVVVYRQLDLKELWEVCLDSALASARILIMVGAASLFSWILTVTGMTAAVVAAVRRAALFARAGAAVRRTCSASSPGCSSTCSRTS